VTIFDGTQMAPGTVFTKIWRLKNVGEVPWPPGARMIFVGGDQIATDESVPLSRESAVMPGEEVDVAIEMSAPMEHGRYLGYWRLTGPFMKRKFGQKVWCHVQVVDPSQSGAEAFDDLHSTLAEIARKKSDLAAGDDAGEDDLDASKEEEETPPLAPEAKVDPEEAKVDPEEAKPEAAKEAAVKTATIVSVDVSDAPALTTAEGSIDCAASDDGVLVTDGMLLEPAAPTSNKEGKALITTAAAAPGPSLVLSVREALAAMGFIDEGMVDAVVAKNGDDVEACARDLAVASEWDPLLDDLEEMGFGNRELNKSLMLKNDGNMKRTVRDLVEE